MPENGEKITYFGETDARGKRVRFGIKAKDRTKHMYVIGKTGMGKSTLLENMAIQDIQNGEGMAFIDPHGSSAEKLLDYVPEERVKDVLYFAPFDLAHPVSFNILDDLGPDKRHLVVNGLMSTFEKIWVDAWSARMAYILQNTLLALLEYPDSTLLGVNRVLVDKNYRKKVVDNVKDPAVKAFWVEEFAKYTDRYTQEATPAIQNKIGQFVSNPLIRNIIGQPNSAFDIREMMDKKKILIVNLAKGKVGEGNANLLGGMLITRIYLAAMSRADASAHELNKLPNFYLYVDEFQSFANKTFENILSEARKYKLNLTIAHQYIEQMEEEVRDAVFGNVGTMITFRVGAYDAEVLEKEFAPTFYADHLVNLGIYQMYLKLMIDGVSSAPFSAVSMPPIEPPPLSFKEQVIAHTREVYGKSRGDVETAIKEWHEAVIPSESASKEEGSGARRDARQSGGERRAAPPALSRESGRGEWKPREGGDRGREGGASREARPAFAARPKENPEAVLSRTRERILRARPRMIETPAASGGSARNDTMRESGSRGTGDNEAFSLKDLKAHTHTLSGRRETDREQRLKHIDAGTRAQNPHTKNRDELRKALSAALVASRNENTKEAPQGNKAHTTAASGGGIAGAPRPSLGRERGEDRQKAAETPRPEKPKHTDAPKNEIPEAELRKILDTSE